MISVRELTSGSFSTRPHGDRHSKVKGRGPVSTRANLTVVSQMVVYLYQYSIPLWYAVKRRKLWRGEIGQMF